MSKFVCFFLFVFLIYSCTKEEDNGLFNSFAGRLLYTRLNQSHTELFILDQSVEQKITESDDGVLTPEWFPDGEKIIFLNFDITGGSLHIINPDGTDDKRIYEIGTSGFNSIYFPRSDLSPDGSKILVARPDSIFILSISNEYEVHRLKVLPCKSTLSYMGWAPDSGKFTCRCEGENTISHLWMYDFNKDSFKNLTPQFTYHVGSQSWSYQSDKVAFSCQNDLFIANGDGTEIFNLTNSLDFGEFRMSFSPIEDQLAYIRSDSLFDLVIYDFETDETDVLISEQAYISKPVVWIEDGKYVAYSSGESLFDEDEYYLFDIVARKALKMIDDKIVNVDWIR